MDSFHLSQLFGGAQSPRSSLSSGGGEVPVMSLQQVLMGIVNEIRSAITSAKRSLAADMHHLQSQRETFQASLKQLWLSFQQEKVRWGESQRHAQSQFLDEADVREIDIGGQQVITTTVKTLRRYPESRLSALTEDTAVYYKGRLFVDRNVQPFTDLIHFVRTSKVRRDMSESEKEEFLREMEYWEVPLASEEKGGKGGPVEFDPVWCAPTLEVESGNMTVKKRQTAHGIVLGSRPLSGEHTNIEFLVETRDRQVKVFLGLVDRSEYTFNYLTSLQWREAPSSYYWNVQSHELVKTDKYGASKMHEEYGCACQVDSPCTLGIIYDPKLQTVSFTRQGISQGTAFTGVPAGLYPAVDLWFESGSVSILQSSKSEPSTETSF